MWLSVSHIFHVLTIPIAASINSLATFALFSPLSIASISRALCSSGVSETRTFLRLAVGGDGSRIAAGEVRGLVPCLVSGLVTGLV